MSSVLFLIDKTLGKYKVLEHIGHGGMSEVYKGQHVQLDRMVAVKVLHPFLADEEGFVVRFKREARIVATLRQPNIVQVFDFDFNDELGIYYMVMEYIDGPTLKTLLNEGPMPVDEVIRIGISIAQALDYAHERGMVHRDVKPANIMFMPDGQPVLTDFGIAKMLSLSELTATGAMVGTPAYMAPEVGIGKVGTSASDIYSLGVVLYQAVTGRLPFESDSPMGIVMQHINDAPPPPSKFVPTIPAALEAVILRALEKQPDVRFSRAIEMAVALQQAGGVETSNGVMALSPLSPSLPESLPVVVQTPPPVTATDDDERLLRTWSTANDKTPAVLTPTLFPKAQVQPAGEEASGKRVRHARLQRVIWFLMSVLVVIVVAGLVWAGIQGDLYPRLQQLLVLAAQRPTEPVVRVTEVVSHTATSTMESLPTATLSPTSLPVAITPTPVVSPARPQVTAVACYPRLKLNQLRVEPDDVVSPGESFAVYIGLRNTGSCAWPKTLQLVFTSGEYMMPPDPISIAALAPDESVQLVVAMQAPDTIGVYTPTWEIHEAAGAMLGSPISVQFSVDDVPLPTPLPSGDSGVASVAIPLTLDAPTLVEWEVDPVQSKWYGTVVMTATGGTGNYRYYQGVVRDDTLLRDGQFAFEARLCMGLPVTVWAASGDEIVRWEGVVPYPDPAGCR